MVPEGWESGRGWGVGCGVWGERGSDGGRAGGRERAAVVPGGRASSCRLPAAAETASSVSRATPSTDSSPPPRLPSGTGSTTAVQPRVGDSGAITLFSASVLFIYFLLFIFF